MPRKEFKILIAVAKPEFAEKAAQALRKFYTVHRAKDISNFSKKIHKLEFDLIVIDYRFAGMKAEDVYQGTILFHPNAFFVVYSQKDKQALAMRLWKRRAIDYISYTSNVFCFTEEVHKAVRWTVQKREVISLAKKVEVVAKTIHDLGARIDKLSSK